MTKRILFGVCVIAAAVSGSVAWAESAGSAGSEEAPWRQAEAPVLTDQTQLTFPEEFTKAGEAYFDLSTKWVIFQAVSRQDAGADPDAPYAMYVAKLTRDEDGSITGIETPIRVSNPGSANTCGYFSPNVPQQIIFGSTMTAPKEEGHAGYQRAKSKYAWMFPSEMEIVTRWVPEIARSYALKVYVPERMTHPRVLIERPGGYDAECSYSPDGRFVLFAGQNPDTQDIDIYVWDSHDQSVRRIVEAPGYDGGPFFSPTGTRICYRSDRAKNDLLQLYVADLTFNDDGAVTGISREYRLTNDQNVNWAPFWDPTGKFLIFTTSRLGHHNYEVYSITAPAPGFVPEGVEVGQRPGPGGKGTVETIDCSGSVASKRITHAAGFDGLPVFNSDGTLMMWTSQRGAEIAGEDRPSSQIWVAKVKGASP